MLDAIGTRRDFLGGVLVVTFGFANGIARAGALRTAAAKTVSVEEVDGFLAIGADGNVTIYSGKVDLGTGVRTALTQIAAEELDLPIDRINYVQWRDSDSSGGGNRAQGVARDVRAAP